jgi:hypothetical protein
VVHDRVDAEVVDGGIEDAVLGGEVEDLQVGAHRLGGERSGHARHGVRDLAHVDEDEHSDHLGALILQGSREALDSRATRDRVVHQQHPPTGDLRSSDPRFVDLVTAVPRLANEGERQPCRQRH